MVNTSVDRFVLRSILLTGLDVRFGVEFVRYERCPDGTAAAHFHDGSSVPADVLVAADGAGSRVRAQYLPHATLDDLGSRCVLGKIARTRPR